MPAMLRIARRAGMLPGMSSTDRLTIPGFLARLVLAIDHGGRFATPG
jgi:hypothetical protein